MIALLVSWAGDTAALYVGRAFGRHKLAPRVSPSKTWEGSIGSVAGGVLAAGIYAHFLIPSAALWVGVGGGGGREHRGAGGRPVRIGLQARRGREGQRDDLPGHGGWLDRIDSSLFSIPVVYALLRVLV